MTLYRYKKNGLLYTITIDGYRRGSAYKVHPYNHNVEIGVSFKGPRFRDFKSNMLLSDFAEVAYR